MRQYGRIATAFWQDEDVATLSIHGKLLACYLLTGPHSTSAGAFRLTPGYIVDDLGWPSETVSQALAELSGIGFMIRCERTYLTVLPRYLKHNPIDNANVGKAVEKAVRALPQKTPVFAEVVKALQTYGKHLREGFLEGLQAAHAEPLPEPSAKPSGKPMPKALAEPLPEPLPEPVRTTEQEQKQDQEQDQNQEQEQKRARRAGSFSEDFERFRIAYPKRPGDPKQPAWEEWRKAVAAGADPEAIIAAAKRYAEASAKPDAPIVAHARTWLHQRRWADWAPTAAVADAPYAPDFAEGVDEATRDVWRAIAAAIGARFGEAALLSWFAKTRIEAPVPGWLRVVAPTRFAADYIRDHFAAVLAPQSVDVVAPAGPGANAANAPVAGKVVPLAAAGSAGAEAMPDIPTFLRRVRA